MWELLKQLFPTLNDAFLGSVCGVVAYLFAGRLAVVCHLHGLRAGDTRKIFHFVIFNIAAAVRLFGQPGSLTVYGCIVAGGICHATWHGHPNTLFKSISRPADAPQERLHVIFPLICTAVGGVLAQLIAGPGSIVAYLVGGWGDAVGEPIGIRWGRHQYAVPSLGGIPAKRSIEGSLAVLLASTLAAAIGLAMLGETGFPLAVKACLVGVAAMITEAASPHGLDNLTILIATATLTRWIHA